MDIRNLIANEATDGWRMAGAYAVQKGRFTIGVALSNNRPRFTLADGDQLVDCCDSAAECKREAARIN